MYDAGFVLFCAPDDSELSLGDARAYIERFGLTQKEVKIVRGVGAYTSVVAKVPLDLVEVK